MYLKPFEITICAMIRYSVMLSSHIYMYQNNQVIR